VEPEALPGVLEALTGGGVQALTCTPPTLEELARFERSELSDTVQFYLNKPSYGEHWARQWLDLARYADSSGYPSDQPREIWAYRDWVIRALNANMPFDQFTIEQNAGDLLPNPTDDQLIATAFHRNTMTQNEGGTDDEEFRNAAIIDRVNTTFAVWMGTTMACAQCHTHKYDPITINEYFQFYAFLNQSADADKKDEAPFHSFDTEEITTVLTFTNDIKDWGSPPTIDEIPSDALIFRRRPAIETLLDVGEDASRKRRLLAPSPDIEVFRIETVPADETLTRLVNALI
jgi:hypothetical protein